MTTIILDNWENYLVNALKEGFEKAYQQSFNKYISLIQYIVAQLPSSIYLYLSQKGLKYYELDFRIYKTYKGNIESLSQIYKEICSSLEDIDIDQKRAQDLANLLRYVTFFSNEDKIFPREEIHKINIRNAIEYIRNRKKLSLNYWENIPATDIYLTFSSTYKKIVESLLHLKEPYVDPLDKTYKLKITPLDLPYNVKPPLLKMIKRYLYKNADVYYNNPGYRFLTNFLQYSSPITGPGIYLVSQIMKGFSDYTYGKNWKKRFLKKLMGIIVLNQLAGSFILDAIDNGSTHYFKRKIGDQIEIHYYVEEGNEWKSFTSKEGLSTGVIGALPSIYFYTKKYPEKFNIEKDENVKVKSIAVIYNKDAPQRSLEKIIVKNNEIKIKIVNKKPQINIKIALKNKLPLQEVLRNKNIANALEESRVEIKGSYYPINKKVMEEIINNAFKNK